MEEQQLKDQLFHKVKTSVVDALKHIQFSLDSKEYLGTIYDWVDLQWGENGMPSFWRSSSAPSDFTAPFRLKIEKGSPPIDPTDSIVSFHELYEFIMQDNYIKRRLLLSNPPETKSDHFNFEKFTAYQIPQRITARYIHLFNKTNFDLNDFLKVYSEFESSIFNEKLQLELHIPILFLQFSFPEARIDEQARIVKMDDSFQKARYYITNFGTGGHSSVLQCATHSLVLDNWNIENQNHLELHQVLSNQDAFPIDHVEKFFGALRTICGQPTGYSQLLYKPIGWSHDWKGDLPSVYGTSVRAYPGFFDNFYWNKDSYPMLNVDDVSRCGIAFRNLMIAKENSLAIAVRRLNRCYNRDEEEDWLIDVTIALEALLSDGNTQEMTHKLALRVAAISQLVPGQSKTAYQIFKDIKAVYGLRSRIVHGKVPSDKDRVIAVSEQEHVPISEIARDYLRNVLRVLIEHPQYRDSSNIDKLVFDRITAVQLEDKNDQP